MKKTRIMLAQVCPGTESLADNAGKIIKGIRTAEAERAELAVFPECSLTSYSVQDAGNLAVSTENPFLDRIRKESLRSGVAVCYGYIEKAGDCLFITQEIVSEGGISFYRKTHLGSKEKTVFSEGNEFTVVNAPVPTGIQLCWESHIPEISSIQRAKGAELLLIPYASPMSRETCRNNWNVHLPARASDNGAFAAACNLLFPEEKGADVFKGGGLAVFDPKGQCIAGCFDTQERFIFCELEGMLPRECKDQNMHEISYFDRKRTELFK